MKNIELLTRDQIAASAREPRNDKTISTEIRQDRGNDIHVSTTVKRPVVQQLPSGRLEIAPDISLEEAIEVIRAMAGSMIAVGRAKTTLRSMLNTCRDQFAGYQQQHLAEAAKAKSANARRGAIMKAEADETMAQHCEKVLAETRVIAGSLSQ
jgi:hypothetical protein